MDLVLHIGAHRTGSTMVAQSLAATIAAHPDCGVALWGPRHLRAIPDFLATVSLLDKDIEPIDRSAAVALDEIASKLAQDVAVLRDQGIRRLIVSEENFIGAMLKNFLRGTFYADVERRLAAFDTLLPMSPTIIALGVRDYGTVWTSAFQYMHQPGREQLDREVAHYVMMNDKRGWPAVAADVRAVWPQSEMLMWQQEGLTREAGNICAQLMGLETDQIVTVDGKINARSGETPPPDLFSYDDAKHLTQRYNHHIQRLKSAGNTRWIGKGAA